MTGPSSEDVDERESGDVDRTSARAGSARHDPGGQGDGGRAGRALARRRLKVDALRAGFALSAALVLVAVRFGCVGFARTPELLAAAAFDTCTVLGLWLAFETLACSGAAPAALGVLFYPLLFGLCAMVFAHSWFFDVAIERRLTLNDLSLAGLAHFFQSALPRRGWVAFLAMYAGLGAVACAAARLFGRKLRALSLRAFLGSWVALALAVGGLSRANRVPSPLFDSAEELWEVATKPKVRPAGTAPEARLAAVLDKSERTQVPRASAYAKVIVLVMETMTAASFERELALLPPDAFLRREEAHFHRFERYFPNNQDSRTGMLDMLFSRVIPYEAYSDEGYAGYRDLARVKSLVDRMHALSYEAAFAVAQTALEEVVGELAWDARLALSASQIEAARRAHKLCFSPDIYEQSCEDLALLPAVVDFVAGRPRAFVYQEFIWGHAAEYNEASGLSNAAYYSAYVDALVRALTERGLADDTLIALTSDHGFRDKGRQHDREVYRIPLLFYAPRLSARSDPRLLSHADFGRLLFEQLDPRTPRAEGNPFVLVVGPTGQGHLFAVGQDGDLLLREKLGFELLVAQHGRVPLSPSALLALFQGYRAQFARSLSTAPARADEVEGRVRLR